MIRNYIKIAWRNFLKNGLYSLINTLGLSIGTAVVILLSLFVINEWTFDQFHRDSDRIYRAWVKEHFKGEVFFNTITPYVLGQELRDNFPDIREVVRYTTMNTQVRNGDFYEQENVHVVEPGFLQMFDFELLNGIPQAVLQEMHSAVVTEEIGQKYFGNPDPTGQIFSMQVGGEWVDFTITGVIEKAPSNSSLQYGILIPFENTKVFMSEGGRQSWTNVNVETYVLLGDDNRPAELEAKIAPFIDGKVAEIYEPGEYLVGLQPLTDIHLNKEYPVGFVGVSDSRYPYILAAVALLILLLACINFTTLSVGRSMARAREVGVRKVSGATRGQLMLQFWSEAILTAAIAVLIGMLLARLLLPVFNTLADKQLVLPFAWPLLLFMGLLTLVIGLLSGIYPSLVLSGFSPINSLRGVISRAGNDSHVVLRGLVGFQFVLSILLVICTMVMTSQMYYLQHKNLGYVKEQLVVLPYSRSGARLTEQFEEGTGVLTRLHNELNGREGFKGAALSMHALGTPGWVKVGYTEESSQKFRDFYLNGIDDQFLPLYNIDLIEGRNFSAETAADQKAVIINQAYAQAFGASVGQPLQEPFQDFTVVGMTTDFNYQSLHNEVMPLVLARQGIDIIRTASDMTYTDFPNPKITVRLSGDQLQGTLVDLGEVWKQIASEQPFDYTFVDDNLDRQYRAEDRLSRIVSIGTGLAIFIACLGLFGIATLMTIRRRKEIGVRKVLGASTVDIVLLLNKNFSLLVLGAAVLAIPLAYYFMQHWLADFAYRVNISVWTFALAALFALLVAWIAVSFQSIKAALANPVRSLRNE